MRRFALAFVTVLMLCAAAYSAIYPPVKWQVEKCEVCYLVKVKTSERKLDIIEVVKGNADSEKPTFDTKYEGYYPAVDQFKDGNIYLLMFNGHAWRRLPAEIMIGFPTGSSFAPQTRKMSLEDVKKTFAELSTPDEEKKE